MSLVNQLLGTKPIREFTGVGSMGTVEAPAPGLVGNPSGQDASLRRRRRRRRPTQEADGSLIPAEAEPIEGGEEVASGVANRPDGKSADAKAETPTIGTDMTSRLLPSLAVVAPDCTPHWLDLGVPIAAAPKANEPRPAEPTPVAQGDRELSGGDFMKLFSRPAGEAAPASADTDLTARAESLAKTVVASESIGDPLRQGVPLPEHVVSNTAVKNTLRRFNFSETKVKI